MTQGSGRRVPAYLCKMRIEGAAMCDDRSCFCWQGTVFHAEDEPGTNPAYALIRLDSFVPVPGPGGQLAIPPDLHRTPIYRRLFADLVHDVPSYPPPAPDSIR
jgi:hypothetical protein